MSKLTAPRDSSQAAAGPAIRVSAVRKAFGQVTALEDIDLTVPAGTLTALLGPNGAGNPVTELWHSLCLQRRVANRARVGGRVVVLRHCRVGLISVSASAAVCA